MTLNLRTITLAVCAAPSLVGYSFSPTTSSPRPRDWKSGLSPVVAGEKKKIINERVLSEPDGWLTDAVEKITSLRDLPPGWNGYQAPGPSLLAIRHATMFVENLVSYNLKPSRIAASAVGGVGVTLRKNGRKAYVEFYNVGLIYVLYSSETGDVETQPIRAEGRGFERSVFEIECFLDA